MRNRELADIDLRCVTCGNRFVFTAGEQQLYQLRGISRQPEHCPNCARGRRLAPRPIRPSQASA